MLDTDSFLYCLGHFFNQTGQLTTTYHLATLIQTEATCTQFQEEWQINTTESIDHSN